MPKRAKAVSPHGEREEALVRKEILLPFSLKPTRRGFQRWLSSQGMSYDEWQELGKHSRKRIKWQYYSEEDLWQYVERR